MRRSSLSAIEQLQAIGAGAPFRAITEEIGHAELSQIRRQRIDWQRTRRLPSPRTERLRV